MVSHYIKLFWAEPSHYTKLETLIIWTARYILVSPTAKVTNRMSGTVHPRDGGEDQSQHNTSLPTASQCRLHCHKLHWADASHQYWTSEHVSPLRLHNQTGIRSLWCGSYSLTRRGKHQNMTRTIPFFHGPFSWIPIPLRSFPSDV